MRVLRIILAICAGALLLLPGIASADTLTATGTLHVQARVLATVSIVVDNSDRITKIYSNTTEPTDNILVFRNAIDAANGTPLTDSIAKQYRAEAPSQMKVGLIYDRDSLEQLLRVYPSVWQRSP